MVMDISAKVAFHLGYWAGKGLDDQELFRAIKNNISPNLKDGYIKTILSHCVQLGYLMRDDEGRFE